MNISFGSINSYSDYKVVGKDSLGTLNGTGTAQQEKYNFCAFDDYTQKGKMRVCIYRYGQNHGPHKEDVEFIVDPQNIEKDSIELVKKAPGYYEDETKRLPRGFNRPGEMEEITKDALQIAKKVLAACKLFTVR